LIDEVEIVDRFEKREVGAAREPTEPRLLALRDFLRDEEREEILIGPLFVLGTDEQVAPHTAGVGEMETLEQRIEIDGALEGSIDGARAVT
jgi:hypothetical protein